MILDRNRVIERTRIELRRRAPNLRYVPVDENTISECVVAAAVAVVDEWNARFEEALKSADTDLLERAMVALAERVRARERGQELQEHVDREAMRRKLAWCPPPDAHADRIYALAAFVGSVGGTIAMPTHDEIVLEYPEHAREQVEREAERLHLLNRAPPYERPVEELRRLAARSPSDERAEMMRRLNPFPIVRDVCEGDCSRGGEGPSCNRPGCQG